MENNRTEVYVFIPANFHLPNLFMKLSPQKLAIYDLITQRRDQSLKAKYKRKNKSNQGTIEPIDIIADQNNSAAKKGSNHGGPTARENATGSTYIGAP